MRSSSAGNKKYKLKPIFNPFSNNDKHAHANAHAKHKSRSKKQAIIAILALVSATSIWFLTPASSIVADFILFTIPIHEDISIGQESWQQIRSKYNYRTVPDQWGVSAIGNELARNIQMQIQMQIQTDSSNGSQFDFCKVLDLNQCQRQIRQYKWSFEVISAPEVNAFALPGGIIRVTDSLLRKLQPTRGEIAALLGHEMGHILHRHGQVKLLKKNLVNTILKALVYEDGDDDQESFGEAVGEILLSGALFLGEMKFSRKDEYEADSAAFDILASSNSYDPRSVKSLLEKLWSISGSSSSISWDKTHPATEERIEVLSKRWNGMTWMEKRKFNGLQR